MSLRDLTIGIHFASDTTELLRANRATDNLRETATEAGRSFENIAHQSARAGQAIRNHFKTASDNLKNFSDRTGKIGDSLTRNLTLPLIGANGLGVVAVKMASDLQENIGKTTEVFKTNSDEVLKWSKTSLKSYGLAQSSALDMASLYGDMGTGMGLSTNEAAKMSMALTGLAADLASFKNIDSAVAQNALKSIYTGETESLKNLGIVMTETNLKEYALSKGIRTNIQDMKQNEKVQLRYNYVMSMTKNAQGDFLRTGGNIANQMRVFKESTKELSAHIGGLLLPKITPLIKKANEFVSSLGEINETQLFTIMKIGLVLASIGPLMKGFSMATSAVSVFLKLMSVTSLPMVAVILSLGAALYLLYKNFDLVKEKSAGVLSVFKNEFGTVLPSLEELFTSLKALFVSILPVLSTVFGGALGLVSGFITHLGGFIQGIITALTGLSDFLTGVFTLDFKKAWDGIKGIVSGVVQAIISLINAVTSAIGGMIQGLKDGLSLGKDTANKIKGTSARGTTGTYGKGTQRGASGTYGRRPLTHGKAGKKVPMYAGGVNNFRGGLAIVGEKGAELVNLPKGSNVTPHDRTVDLFKNSKRFMDITPVSNVSNVTSHDKTLDLFKNSKNFMDITPVSNVSNTKNYSGNKTYTFAPVINVQGENAREIATRTREEVRKIFEDFISECEVSY